MLNQMAGPMTWELVVDLARQLGPIDVLTGHPDTLAKTPPQGVRLVPAVAYRRGSLLVRFWSWLRYTLHAFFWLSRQPADVPILLFSNPPLALWMVRWLHYWRGTPYAVMVHDIFPDVLVRKGVVSERAWLVRCWRWLNRRGYEHATLVLTLGEYMAETLTRQFEPAQTSAGEIQIVAPWSDDELIRPIRKEENWFAKEHDQVGKLTCMYSGNMGLGHDLESMCEAAQGLVDRPTIQFMFIGAGPKWQLVDDARQQYGLTNVTVLGWQAEEVLPYSLATADLGLVSLEEELSGLAVPSKAFYFLAAHVPLIAVCNERTELADLVQKYDCGQVVPPRAPREIQAIVERVASDPAILTRWKSGAAQAMNEFRRDKSTRRFAELLQVHLNITAAAPDSRGGSGLDGVDRLMASNVGDF